MSNTATLPLEIKLLVDQPCSGAKNPVVLSDGKVVEVIEDGVSRKPKQTSFNAICNWLMNSVFEPVSFRWLDKTHPGTRKRECVYRRKEEMKDDGKLMELARKAKARYPELTTRPQNAAELVRAGKVKRISSSTWEVQSQTSEDTYAVDIEARSCNCYDAQNNKPRWCKHQIACLMVLKLQVAPDPVRIHREEKRIAALQAGAILI